jgi:hypothetical protein
MRVQIAVQLLKTIHAFPPELEGDTVDGLCLPKPETLKLKLNAKPQTLDPTP